MSSLELGSEERRGRAGTEGIGGLGTGQEDIGTTDQGADLLLQLLGERWKEGTGRKVEGGSGGGGLEEAASKEEQGAGCSTGKGPGGPSAAIGGGSCCWEKGWRGADGARAGAHEKG